MTSARPRLSCLPKAVGVGLKPQHFRAILETRPALGFFEIHAENYMVAGGPFHHYLERIRADYALSIHGVGLSIGGEQPLNEAHLQRLDLLLQRYQPESFSEHLAWSSHDDIYFNDLLPAPYHADTLLRVCEHIDQVQERLGRPMLLENPATYVEFQACTMAETEFIFEVIQRTGCGLLLDINNAYISCVNHGRDPLTYLRALPLDRVGEIHLAGFAEAQDTAGDRLLIDTHGTAVAQDVWDLYAKVLDQIGRTATLIERDNDIPSLALLQAEAYRAQTMMAALDVEDVEPGGGLR